MLYYDGNEVSEELTSIREENQKSAIFFTIGIF